MTASPQRTEPSMWPLADSTSSDAVLVSSLLPTTSPRTRPSIRMPPAKATSPVISTPSAMSVESCAVLMKGCRFESPNIAISFAECLLLVLAAFAGLAEKVQLVLRFGELLVERIDLALELLAACLGDA